MFQEEGEATRKSICFGYLEAFFLGDKMLIETICKQFQMTGFDVEIICAIANVTIYDDGEKRYIKDQDFDLITRMMVEDDENDYPYQPIPKKVISMNRYRQRERRTD